MPSPPFAESRSPSQLEPRSGRRGPEQTELVHWGEVGGLCLGCRDVGGTGEVGRASGTSSACAEFPHWGKWADFVSDAAMWTVLGRRVVHPGQVRHAQRLAHAQSRSQGRREIATRRSEGRMSRVSAAGSRTCPSRPRPARRGASGARAGSPTRGAGTDWGKWADFVSDAAMWVVLGRRVVHPGQVRHAQRLAHAQSRSQARGEIATRRSEGRMLRVSPAWSRTCPSRPRPASQGAPAPRAGTDKVRPQGGPERTGTSGRTLSRMPRCGRYWRGGWCIRDKFGMRKGWVSRSRGIEAERGGSQSRPRSEGRDVSRSVHLPGAELVCSGQDRSGEEHPSRAPEQTKSAHMGRTTGQVGGLCLGCRDVGGTGEAGGASGTSSAWRKRMGLDAAEDRRGNGGESMVNRPRRGWVSGVEGSRPESSRRRHAARFALAAREVCRGFMGCAGIPFLLGWNRGAGAGVGTPAPVRSGAHLKRRVRVPPDQPLTGREPKVTASPRGGVESNWRRTTGPYERNSIRHS